VQVVAAINTIELNSLDDHEFDSDFKRPIMRNLDIFDFLQYTFGFQVISIILLTSRFINHPHWKVSLPKFILIANSADSDISYETQWFLFFQFWDFEDSKVYC